MNVKHENERKFLRSGLQRNCPSDLKFRLDMVPVRNERDTDERKKKKELVENYPLHFCINFQHNHQLKRHKHSRFGNVSQETKNRYFFNTFQLNSMLLSVSSFCNAQSHCCHFTQPHHSIQLCQVVWPLSSFNSFIFFTFAHKVDGFFPLNLIFFIGIELWLKNGPSILGFAFGIFLASSSAIPSLLPDFASRHS